MRGFEYDIVIIPYTERIARFVCMLLCGMCILISAESRAQSYFSSDARFSDDISPFPKWTGTLSRSDTQKNLPADDCGNEKFHPCHMEEKWQGMLSKLQGKPLPEQLRAVNTYGNAFPYTQDTNNWGMEDFWETIYEFHAVSGDCEDYAITKYYALKALGVPPSRMRIIIVQDFNLGGIIHAILGVYSNGDTNGLMILDNQIKQVIPAKKIYHYRPIYSINEHGWWSYLPR